MHVGFIGVSESIRPLIDAFIHHLKTEYISASNEGYIATGIILILRAIVPGPFPFPKHDWNVVSVF
jgi:hypothetical protein